MRRLSLGLVAAATLTIAVPATATTLVSDYSLLTSGSTTLSSQTIAGRAVVGGAFVANSSTIGNKLTAAADGTPVLMVGGAFKYDNSTMPHGSVIHVGANTSDKGPFYSNEVKTPNGTVTQGALPVNPGQLFDTALKASADLAALTTTGGFEILNNNGVGRLTGLTGGVNVYRLNSVDLSRIYKLQLVGAADANTSVVINIDAASVTNSLAFDFGTVATEKVVLNFANAATVTLNGWNLPGTLLAPKAAVTQSGGSIAGAVIAASFNGQGGGNIGGFGYTAPIGSTSAVPEPAAWAMMIGGVGLIGGAMRRRRAATRTAALAA